jgi:hypothetical protein
MGCKHSVLDKVEPYYVKNGLSSVLPKRYEHPRKVNPKDVNVIVIKKSVGKSKENVKQENKIIEENINIEEETKTPPPIIEPDDIGRRQRLEKRMLIRKKYETNMNTYNIYMKYINKNPGTMKALLKELVNNYLNIVVDLDNSNMYYINNIFLTNKFYRDFLISNPDISENSINSPERIYTTWEPPIIKNRTIMMRYIDYLCDSKIIKLGLDGNSITGDVNFKLIFNFIEQDDYLTIYGKNLISYIRELLYRDKSNILYNAIRDYKRKMNMINNRLVYRITKLGLHGM